MARPRGMPRRALAGGAVPQTLWRVTPIARSRPAWRASRSPFPAVPPRAAGGAGARKRLLPGGL
eukprot:454491-Lingulodinium_polyedra.AAC.1